MNSFRKVVLALGLIIASSSASAMPEEAREWVMRMLSASQSLNYKGSMVGIRDSKVELMGIVHRIDERGEQERIFSLNGAPREIIRRSGELICYLPDKNLGLQSKLFTERRFFPTFTDVELARLDEYYDFELGQVERIVNREAQMISIKPADEYRYGYQLWIDKQTGLLLQSAFVNHEGIALERYMFTHVDINIPIDDAELEPSETAKSGLNWTLFESTAEVDHSQLKCNLDGLPSGFELVHAMVKPATDRQNMMGQYVFSDGLSNFSLFVEHMYQADKMEMDGAYQLGIVNAYSHVVDGNRITMMGEVPQITAETVAMSVSNCK